MPDPKAIKQAKAFIKSAEDDRYYGGPSSPGWQDREKGAEIMSQLLFMLKKSKESKKQAKKHKAKTDKEIQPKPALPDTKALTEKDIYVLADTIRWHIQYDPKAGYMLDQLVALALESRNQHVKALNLMS